MAVHSLRVPEKVVGQRSLSVVHRLLGVQSVIIVLLSINRLSTLTLGYVLPNQFLRWVDLNNMLVLPLASVFASYLLKKHLEAPYPLAVRESRTTLILSSGFLVGVYLLAASYGDHEVTNYLNTRFCIGQAEATSAICQIIAFNDDQFSHWLFFTGFVLVNSALMLWQVLFPQAGALTRADQALLIFNGLFIALGIFANLGFEVIGLDLYIVALLAGLALALLWRKGQQPLLVYYATAYSVGLLLTVLYKTL